MTAGPNLVQFDPATGSETVTPLPNGGYAHAVNSNRQAAGSFGAATALWQVDAGGNVQSMLALSPLPGYAGSVGNCLSALGQVAGNSYAPGGQSLRATLWQNGPNPTDLGSLSNKNPYNNALGVNTVNGVLQVVGFDIDWSHGSRAFIWKKGVMTNLNSLISASGVNLRQASAINTQGQIVGYADLTLSKYNTETHGFLLTPK
jgi:probable HAF family extracellular repeat protein